MEDGHFIDDPLVVCVNQQQAIEKVAPYYETETPEHFNIDYMDSIIV